MKPALAELLHNPLLWRGDSLARTEASIATGFPLLDCELPGGGWPKATLTELLHDCEGVGEMRLLLPVLKRLVQAGEWIALVAPPHIPYAPAFSSCGIDPARVIVIRAAEENGAWWAAEQVLRANSAGALLFWPDAMREQSLRRLQLAAHEGQALAFFFTGTTRAAQPSPAPLRIRLSLADEAGAHLRVDIFKRRGGVMTRPLLLDVAASYPTLEAATAAQDEVALMQHPIRLVAKRERLLISRSASFTRRYPVDGPHARVWNRALGHADEVRRVPAPDPRNNENQARDDDSGERHRVSHLNEPTT